MKRILLILCVVLAASPCFATTKLYLKQPLSSFNSTYGYANPTQSVLAATTSVTKSVASGTNIQWTKTSGGTTVQWISPPLAAGTTISGTFTANFWGSENSTSCNCGERVVVVLDPGGTGSCSGSTIADTSRGTELTTSVTVQNWTATPTSTAVSAGDRICIQPRITNVGTMGGSTFTVTNSYGGATVGAAGDTYIQFNENLTFQSEGEFIQDVKAALNTALTLPSTASGNLIVVSVFWNDTTSTCTLSDGANTFTQIGSRQGIGANSQAFFYAKNITGGSRTITPTLSNSPTAFIVTGREYAGLDTSSPLDAASPATGTGSGTALATGNLTTTSANEILIATAGSDGTSADINGGTGYVKRNVDVAGGDMGEDKSVTSTGTYTATGTATVSGNWAIIVAGFLWGTQPSPPPSCSPTLTLVHVGSCG